jgi:protein SCO1/2
VLDTPDLTLIDQHDRLRRFYTELVRDRQVVIQLMYTSCSNACPPATRNLLAAHELLGALGRRLHYIAITLAPQSDTPDQLRAYQAAHGLGDNWTLLTGTPQRVDSLTRALGLVSAASAAAGDWFDHSAMALVGDEPRLRWGHANLLLGSPRGLARMIRFELR